MGIPILSFFTGGGFLDIGFEEAGFNIIWTNELNPKFADMYEFGITSWRRSNKLLSPNAKISCRTSIDKLTADDVIRDAFSTSRPPLFGVIGGPPCVDFCIGGKNKGANGTNGRLLGVFAELIKELKPDFFVIENVPGLRNTKKHKTYLDMIIKGFRDTPHNYHVISKIVSALEIGVPQNRERLFIIGFNEKMVKTMVNEDSSEDCLGSFKWPHAKYPNANSFPWPTTSPFGESPILPKGIPIELTVNPLLGGPIDPENLANGKEYFHPYSLKFNEIKEGDDSRKSFKRLHRHRYSPTAWYGNNEVHLHPWKPRRLSVREALRIQTVPDTYLLPVEYPLTAKFKLIANGVPCKLAKAIAESVMASIPPNVIRGIET